jgi:DNA-binding MarR family transcriptional regulator
MKSTNSARGNGVTRTAPKNQRSPAAGEEVDDFVTAVLTASRVLVGVSARSLAAVEETVTVTQFRTLVVLEGQGETNLNRLAEALDVNSSTAVRMIDRLLVASLVTRHENPDNRREVLLALTPEGRRIVDTVTTNRRRDIARIVATMADGERTHLVVALTAFAEAAGEPGPATDSLGW